MTSAAMAMVRVFMTHPSPGCPRITQGSASSGSSNVHEAVTPPSPGLPTVPTMLLRAAATALTGATAVYVLVWRLVLSLDEHDPVTVP